MTSPVVSVILPTYQRCDSVARLLRALAQQTLAPEEYEVIVSIDGSNDGTREMLKVFTAPYRLRWVWQPNRGRAAACNAAIRMAEGEVLVILDDDMEPAPDCLEQHRRAHPIGSRLGLMGAVPISNAADAPPIATYMAAKFNRHLKKLARANHGLTLRDFYSGHFSIRREVLFEVGLFDEAFRIYGNEDLELSLRLKEAQVTLSYAPQAFARQHYSKDFAALARDTIAKGETAVLLASKHPTALSALQLSTTHQESWRWRAARNLLLQLSRLWPSTPERVMAGVTWLERRRSKYLHVAYRFALDYLYWLGVKAALRKNQRTGQGLTSLVGRRQV